jgi:hypothetical protein
MSHGVTAPRNLPWLRISEVAPGPGFSQPASASLLYVRSRAIVYGRKNFPLPTRTAPRPQHPAVIPRNRAARLSPATMQSTPAFAAPATLGARALAGAALAAPPACAAGPTMALSRRAALGAGLGALGAALLPAAAFAKGGDGAKISVFGVGGASSPFTAGVQTGGTVVYSRFSEDEMAYFKSIVDASGERLAQAKASIDIKSWEDIRSLIRLETSLLRTTSMYFAHMGCGIRM